MKKILVLTALLYAALYINAQEDTLTEKTLGEVVVSANKFSERKRNVNSENRYYNCQNNRQHQCTKYG